MKVWILLTTLAFDGDLYSNAKVFYKKEDAQKALDEFVRDKSQDAEDNQWIIESYTSRDNEGGGVHGWCAYEGGYYSQNHYEATIFCSEVM